MLADTDVSKLRKCILNQ